jgi:glycosyltransferase involved in cell wall biosynthesis
MNRPSFTIVIPTFQRRDTLCAAIEAICQISYAGEVDIVVVVDGSTDGSAEAVSEIKCPFPLNVVSQANAGAARARNRGATLATGEIILFLDDDMMCCPDIIEQHAMSYAVGADAVLGDIPLDVNAPKNFLSVAVGDWAEERGRRLKEGGTLTLFDLLTGQLSIRRDVFEALGGFDEDFTQNGSFGNEDLDLGTRLLERYTVVFNGHAISRQRYVVGYRQVMQQWYQAGQADVLYARKHPAKAADLFDLHGAAKRSTRHLVIPIAHLPVVSWAAAALSSLLAERLWGKSRLTDRLISSLFFFSRDLLYWSGVKSNGGIPKRNSILVLCYHSISDLSHDRILKPYGVTKKSLEEQLDSLRRRGAVFISASEFAACLQSGSPVPARAILLTFDDCYAELTTIAREVLRPRQIPALAFAVSGIETYSNEWDQQIGATRLELLRDEQLLELQNLGVEIGCHSKSHGELPKMNSARLVEETAGAASALSAIGLPAPRFFAYPYGECDTASKAAVKEAGFIAAFGLKRGLMSSSSDTMDLPRVEILENDRGWRFWLKTNMAYISRIIA